MTSPTASPPAAPPAPEPSTRETGGPGSARDLARRVLFPLALVCGVLLLIDPFIHKHGPIAIEHLWGFYGLFGLLACFVLVWGGKLVHMALTRAED